MALHQQLTQVRVSLPLYCSVRILVTTPRRTHVQCCTCPFGQATFKESDIGINGMVVRGVWLTSTTHLA
jgi:hypothetical protein